MLTEELVTAGCTVLAAAGSLVGIIFVGGKQVGRVEAAIARLTNIETKLNKVDEHTAQIGTVSEVLTRMRSDHKQLASKVDEMKEEFGFIRGRLSSHHD